MNTQLSTSDSSTLQVGKGLNADLTVTGHLKLERLNSLGEVLQTSEIHNTITTAGRNGLADQMLDAPTLAKPISMAIGTGTPTATALGAENARGAFTSKTRSTNVVTFVGFYAAGVGTGSITEAGIFDASGANSGNMWTSSSFAAITKGANDTLQITWTVTVN